MKLALAPSWDQSLVLPLGGVLYSPISKLTAIFVLCRKCSKCPLWAVLKFRRIILTSAMSTPPAVIPRAPTVAPVILNTLGMV